MYVNYPEMLVRAALGNSVLELRKLLDDGAAQSTDPDAPRGFTGGRPGSKRERLARFWWRNRAGVLSGKL